MPNPEAIPPQEADPENLNKDDVLKKAGLNQTVRRRLAENRIWVNTVGEGKDMRPDIETENVYYQVREGDSFRPAKMPFLPLEGNKVEQVTTSSDGVSAFHLENERTGEKRVFVFSVEKEMPSYYKPSQFDDAEKNPGKQHEAQKRQADEEASRQEEQTVLAKIESEFS
jgi:hypothetical protein